jgi:hypothetical protein
LVAAVAASNLVSSCPLAHGLIGGPRRDWCTGFASEETAMRIHELIVLLTLCGVALPSFAEETPPAAADQAKAKKSRKKSRHDRKEDRKEDKVERKEDKAERKADRRD